MPVDVVRDTAVHILIRVLDEGAYLSIALDKALHKKDLSERGRRFLTQLVYGTVRHRILCDYVLAPLLHQPMDELPRPIVAILRMGVFQALFCDQVTFPSMVHTSVDLAKKNGHAGTARLTNAVLRKAPFSLDKVRLPDRETALPEFLSIRYSIPRWLVDDWITEYGPETAENLCATSNINTPNALRVNLLKTTVDEILPRLTNSGCRAEKRTPIPEEITVLEGMPPARTKLFGAGEFFVQDPASMLPAHLMEPQPGERVLDLCAAPGGKTTHLAQLAGGKAHITAMDIHPGKLRLIRENVYRLDLSGVNVVCGDGRKAPFDQGFDRILVDAPCSGLGTLRRHPDMKWRIEREDLPRLAELQRDLLRCAVRLCKNNGLIVYSVCTFSR
ncbi:MAG: 16S rRNA (cytosine(967)-C(5))-methyltransferase RsmB, partial [Candidatus Hydrogenedentes bacterium]|nr:16S rRNA (cytosine(967)-C(5))-methyltransferase RsmB [Candidatus Hydrogenedentota bacterium]